MVANNDYSQCFTGVGCTSNYDGSGAFNVCDNLTLDVCGECGGTASSIDDCDSGGGLRFLTSHCFFCFFSDYFSHFQLYRLPDSCT